MSDEADAPADPDGQGGARTEEGPGDDLEEVPSDLAVLPLRGTVAFPGLVLPLTFGRASSLRLIEEALPQGRTLAFFLQRDPRADDPGAGGLHQVGVAGKVLKMVRPSEDTAVLLVQVGPRLRAAEFTQSEPYLRARVEMVESHAPDFGEDYWTAALGNLRETATSLVKLHPDLPGEAEAAINGIEKPERLVDFLAGNLSIEPEKKQALLEEPDVGRRLQRVQEHIDNQLRIAELQQKLRADVETEISGAQKRAYLREQLRAIQRELGEEGSGAEQAEDLRARLEEAQLPEPAMEQAERELKRLDIIPPASPEHSVIVSYLETLAELPWQKLSDDNLDLAQARAVLDRDHYGLEKVKKRLVEFIAVRKLNPAGQGPILCFLGPPGVGKTSIGQSVADALGREFVRVALGGIRDESEIRGHRRTYIGSMPGRIIQELRRAGTRNPVFMLDELDKVGSDFRGDPASALLEVLDPAQNHAFSDRYLDVPFDLSQCIFIATCNTMGTVPAPLRDRMEVIELPGYTEDEKLHIANGYLIKRQLAENGLEPGQCRWTEAAVRAVIDDYTREAGVRNLEREIGAVCRSIAAAAAAGELQDGGVEVGPEKVAEVLGPPRFVREVKLRASGPGVVTGLAYTPTGGEVLHIEALKFPGKGAITLTGQLGDVMKESVQAAYSLVRSRANELGIEAEAFEKSDVHVHVPAGAVPKDGPSAGAAMFTALASLFSGRSVDRDVAMTGEISLRGLVLPIGGLKEKSIAALRAGVKKIIIPKLNEKDLPDLPGPVRDGLEIVPVETVDDVLAQALVAEGVS